MSNRLRENGNILFDLIKFQCQIIYCNISAINKNEFTKIRHLLMTNFPYINCSIQKRKPTNYYFRYIPKDSDAKTESTLFLSK
ncbi:MAG: hypothetical protein MJ252_03155 [archaeon]|nr:hypothetical protein [archaeon]